MKYGCIGEHLKHSFSKEIHAKISDYDYEICEIERDALMNFATGRNFSAINVTIPYKELIMPYLNYIDEYAAEIGSVNTVVNKDGKLYGYNTDFYGMRALIKHIGIPVSGKKVIILGTGGTSKTAVTVARSLSAKEVIRVSRTRKEDAISYEELYENHTDADVIINTTPAGMFPKIFNTPLDISKFDRLSGVVDTIYNPLRSILVMQAKERGILAEGGLYMLVAQAVRASEYFTDTKYDDAVIDKIFNDMINEKENIVLIGMPGAGKSTVGKILAKKYCRTLVDTDTLIEKKTGKKISDIFKESGENEFRKIETELIREVTANTGLIISTGGGAILNPDNVAALRQNGRIYFIDRPLDSLVPTEDRPLAQSYEAVAKRYHERYEKYVALADVAVSAECSAEEVAKKIGKDFENR